MNSRELEEKLEKDNLTLKEHIMKLQQTIKQIKSEMMTGDSKEENNQTLRLDKKINKTNLNKNSIPHHEKYSPNYIHQDDDNNLKFSFNVHDNKQKSIKENNSKEKIKEEKEKIKMNIYKDNFDKIRKEKEILEKTEKLKKESNLGKKHSEMDQDEIIMFQKNLRNNYVKEEVNKKNTHDEDKEDEYKTGDLDTNNLNIEDLRLDHLEEKNKTKSQPDFIKQNEEKASIKSYKEKNTKEFIEKKEINPNNKGQYTNLSTKNENSFDRRRPNKLKEDLIITNDGKVTYEKRKLEPNRKKENFYPKSESNTDSYDDSFEYKVKTLQQEKIKRENPDTKQNYIHHKNSKGNFQSVKSKTTEVKKNLRSQSKTINYATTPYDKSPTAEKKNILNKNDSVKKLNTVNIPSKSKTKNNSIIEYNNESSQNMKMEIIQLKKEMNKLKSENKKIKELYDKERERNKMYKDFSEDLMKQYE